MQQTIEHAERHAGAHRPAEPDARHWAMALAPYREPSLARSLAELARHRGAVRGLVAPDAAQPRAIRYWLCLLLAVPAAGFLVRLFMIQHDCGHGSFFRRRRANDWLGRVLGVLTLTPYGYWRRTHAMHHATSGHLGRRGIGRRRHPDRARVPEPAGVAPRSLPPEAPPDRRARRRAVLPVRAQAPPAGAADARGPGTLAQRHVDQPRDRGGARSPGGAPGAARLPAGPDADHPARLVRRRLAVLRAAPVRAHLLGVGRGLEPPHRRPARQLALRPAAACCAGSRPTSASITSITWRAGSPATGSARRCATTRSCARSVA